MDAEKGLPSYSAAVSETTSSSHLTVHRHLRRRRTIRWLVLTCLCFIAYAQWRQIPAKQHFEKASAHAAINQHGLSVARLKDDLAQCAKLQAKVVEPKGLGRERNERYINGFKPTLIRNATIWVGEPAEGTSKSDARAGKGWSWLPEMDVYLERGLIRNVEKTGVVSTKQLSKQSGDDVLVYNAHGRQLTSGIIDLHSHVGVDALPDLLGTSDTNELSSDTTPYVRSKDGFQPSDYQIQVIKSGGVTTSLILPGSGNNIGGEAYVIKHATGKGDGREEISFQDMLADPSESLRYMKMACGENAKRTYGRIGERGPFSRLGESWEFRHAFEQAAKLVREQDDWCAAAQEFGVEDVSAYLPMDLKWESLGAVLRGQVFVNTHCYTVPDLEAFVDHTNEFNFSVKAFHHAHQTYLVPEILKRTWGGRPPASALFATNMYYKAESYIGSEYAGKYLYDEGLVPIYVSDNPVLNAQHVVFEAAKGYKFGLPYHAALASVTTEPAEHLGLSERIGKIKSGFDADIVVWDADPMSVGATPVQVWIDGTAQYKDPVVLKKHVESPIVPETALGTVRKPVGTLSDLVITGLVSDWHTNEISSNDDTFNVVVLDGKLACVGSCEASIRSVGANAKTVQLKNGCLTPSFTAFGSTIGLNAIDAEKSTEDGKVNAETWARAVDGLQLESKKLAAAHQYGITQAISAPRSGGGGARHGVSAGFLTGAHNALNKGAVFASDAAVHYSLLESAKSEKTPSISALIGNLRGKLLTAVDSADSKDKKETAPHSEESYLEHVVTGAMPLVITVHSADTIAALLTLKGEIEDAINETFNAKKSSKLNLVIFGGAESHLVADQLASASVGVILAPLQSYATTWDQRRSLSGAPLTNGTTVDVLVAAGVKVGIGIEEDWLVRDLQLLAARAYRNGNGKISQKEAMGMISGNIYDLLGLSEKEEAARGHFVVHEGNPFDIASRIVAVGGGLGEVTLFT